MDDLDEFIAEEMQDPKFAEAYAEAGKRFSGLKQRRCRLGDCVEYYDPETDRVVGLVGPLGCPCGEE